MAEIKEAIIQGGLAEYPESLEPLANAVSTGEGRLVENATPITLNWAMDNPDWYDEITAGKLIIGHSYGSLLVRRSGIIVALDGVEPTSLPKAMGAANKIKKNMKTLVGESGVPENDQKASDRELRSGLWNAARVAWRTRTASTLGHLVAGGKEAFPEGRLYVPYADSEYQFAGQEEVDEARRNGITAELAQGTHNHALRHPQETVRMIGRLLG